MTKEQIKEKAEKYLDKRAFPNPRKTLCDVVNWCGDEPENRFYSETKLIEFLVEFSIEINDMEK